MSGSAQLSESRGTISSAPVRVHATDWPRHARPLYRSDLLTIVDTTCGGALDECALEGLRGSNRLVFTRAGATISRGRQAISPLVVANPGDVLLLDASECSRVGHSADRSHQCTTFAFASAMTAESVWHSRAPGGGAPRRAALHEVVNLRVLVRYHRLRRMLLAPAHGQPLSPLGVEEEALALVHDVLDASSHASGAGPHGDESKRSRRRREMVEAAKTILASSPAATHRLADVADALGVSPSHLAHVFRHEVGMPLHRYLLHIRMALALDRLSAGADDLSRLALDLGFSTHSHFSAAFRQCFDVSPREVRRVLRRPLSAVPRVDRRVMSGRRSCVVR
jgi:AraC-like DNA-binding protein